MFACVFLPFHLFRVAYIRTSAWLLSHNGIYSLFPTSEYPQEGTLCENTLPLFTWREERAPWEFPLQPTPDPTLLFDLSPPELTFFLTLPFLYLIGTPIKTL